MASSKPVSNLLDHICCGVCMERYDNTHHVPKILSCEHTFCLKCLNKLSVCLNLYNVVDCPVCRTKHTVPSGWFTTNRAMLDIVDELDRYQDRTQTSVVLKCSEHKDTECVLVCIDCVTGLCPKCLKQSAHHGHQLEEISEAKAVLTPAFEKQVKEEQAVLEKMLSMINDSKHSVTELTKAESNMKKIYAEVDKIIVAWKKDQLLQLGSFKQVSITRENELQTERGLLQSLLEQRNIDIGIMIAKLKSNSVQKEQSLDTLAQCLDTADSYKFLEQTQLLIERLQLVFSNQELVTSKVLKPVTPDVKAKAVQSKVESEASPAENEQADTEEDNSKHPDSASANTKHKSSAILQVIPTFEKHYVLPSSDEDEDETEDEGNVETASNVETDSYQVCKEKRNCTFTKVVNGTDGLIGQINDDIIFYRFKTGKCELCQKDAFHTRQYHHCLSSWKDVKKGPHHSFAIETMRKFYANL